MPNPFTLSAAAQPLYDDYLKKKAARIADDGNLATQQGGLVSDQAAVTAAQNAVITRQGVIATLAAKDNAELQAENASLTTLVNQLMADLQSLVPNPPA